MRRGDLRTRVPVVSADETGRLARSFNDMVAGLQERERLHEAFGAYVGPSVAEMVLRDGTHLDGEELQVSILCLDIRDFTRFAERASAREVVDRLNEFYELVVPLLVRHGGYPDKYVGDGLLGVFGAPEPIVAHADRAVAAAIEIARAVQERYGERPARRDRRELRARGRGDGRRRRARRVHRDRRPGQHGGARGGG